MTTPCPSESGQVGVRIVGSGSVLPEKCLTNADLERMMDTNDEWIVQRTGIHERWMIDPEMGESSYTLGAEALRRALDDANVEATDMDLLLVATITPEMICPPTSCRIADAIGAGAVGAIDISAACCGFVYALNIAHDLIRGGGLYRTVAVVGTDTMTGYTDYTDAGRSTAILFGDGAGAAILKATDDTSKGIIAQAMHSDGAGWKEIYVPKCANDLPEGAEFDESKYGFVHMNGRKVFKFAVGTFPGLIRETLDKAGLNPEDIDHYICHQSNARILSAARDRFGLPEEKLYINIDRRGNTLAASVPLCLDELRRAGRVREGQRVMFLAFGGGLTWGSSLWQL